MTRVSQHTDITDRQYENGARFPDGFTPDFHPSFLDDRRIPEKDLFIWTPPVWDRHLDGGLFVKLDQACRQLTGFDRYIPLVIFLMVETGLRIEDLCAVKARAKCVLRSIRLTYISSKLRHQPRWPEEHEARTIVLSVRVRMYLEEVVAALKADNRFDPSLAIIPIAPVGIRTAFERVVKLAEVDIGEPLSDALHSDAEARFKEAGLTKTERDIMQIGFNKNRILPGSQADLASIQNKLDWYFLDGKTYEEAKHNLPIIPAEQIISTA